MSDSLLPHGLYSPWNSPGQNTGVGSVSLFWGIFPTQGSNLGVLHCRQILYQLSHKGSPRILEWVAYPFSSGSFWPRNRTGVSCIAGRFFTNWAIREALMKTYLLRKSIVGFLPFLLLTFSSTHKLIAVLISPMLEHGDRGEERVSGNPLLDWYCCKTASFLSVAHFSYNFFLTNSGSLDWS